MTITGYKQLLFIVLLLCVPLSRCFRNAPIAATSSGVYLSHTTTTGNIRGIATIYLSGEIVDEDVLKRFPITKSKPLVDHRQLEYLKEKKVQGYGDDVSAESLWPGVDFDVPYTLKGCITKFVSHSTPRFIIASTAVLAGIRSIMPWTPLTDLLVITGTIGFWVVQEWFLHRYVLHEPLIEGGWLGYHIHKEHHSIPFYHVSLDGPDIAVVWGATICALSFIIFPGESLNVCRMDFVLTYYLMGLLYEWTHYLTHTRYKPKTAFVRSLKAHHMTHHLDDNRCKFAFTVPLLDKLFRTSNVRVTG